MDKNYIFYLGVPARFASPAALYAATPQALAVGLMVAAVASSGRSAAPCAPSAHAFAGFSLQSLTHDKATIYNNHKPVSYS